MTHPTKDPYRTRTYEQWLRSWGAAEATISARLVIARTAARSWPDPTVVTAEHLETFLADPRFSGWTRSTYYSHLRSLFGYLAKTQALAVDPTTGVRRPRPPKAKPRPLSAEETQLVLGAATGPLRTWLLLGLFAGLRAHEVAKIQSRDVFEDSIYVRGKGGVDAMVPTHPLIWATAQTYGPGFWFPTAGAHGHIQATRLSTAVTTHFSDLGVEGSFHRCRHTYGTTLLRAGVNLRVVQTLMRHQSLTTTASYLAVDDDERTAAVRLLAA